jgi:hypothetical protein
VRTGPSTPPAERPTFLIFAEVGARRTADNT